MIQHKIQRTHTRHALSSSPKVKTPFFDYFGAASDPVLILDLALTVIYANPVAIKFFNFHASSAKPRFFKDCVTVDSLHKVNSLLKRVVDESRQVRFELKAIDRYHERVECEATFVPVVSGSVVEAFRVTIRDIRQERQMEDLVREAEKMEAIQYFVAGTTKELKHPLLAILKRIESIENKYKGRSFEYVSFKEFTHIMNFLHMMHKQIKYCYDTTTKLTHMNKKRLKFESNYCQANDVVREVIRLKGNYFNLANVKVRLRLQDSLPSVDLGEIELNQIVSNIIDNAVQAMPAGGNLTVSTSTVVDAQQVRIDIMDDGVGIPADELPHIFEPFFTTKQRGLDRNAGLGLSIVYSLVKSNQGHISVKSSLRKGTTVHLTFPMTKHASLSKILSK